MTITEESKPQKARLARAYKTLNPDKTSWAKPAATWKASLGKLTGGLNVPFKSAVTLIAAWIVLEIGWPILVLMGIVMAGDVWQIPITIPCVFICVYGLILVSCSNIIRDIVLQLSQRRDNLVKALYRGYFWSILAIGMICMVHNYFLTHMPLLFNMPIIIIIPFEILGTTTPIPIPLGVTKYYLNYLVVLLVYVIGITGACVGGLEVFEYFKSVSQKHGLYGSMMNILLHTAYPTVNVILSLVFLTAIDNYIRWGLV